MGSEMCIRDRNSYGREIMDRHLDICLDAGLNVEGTNGEVALGQWEFHIISKGAEEAGLRSNSTHATLHR